MEAQLGAKYQKRGGCMVTAVLVHSLINIHCKKLIRGHEYIG